MARVLAIKSTPLRLPGAPTVLITTTLKINSYLFINLIVNLLMDLDICLNLCNIDKIYQLNQKLTPDTPDHGFFFYRIATKKYTPPYISPWKIVQALNPWLMKTCILICFSIYLFIYFGSRLGQKCRFDKRKSHFKAHAICDCGCHEIML